MSQPTEPTRPTHRDDASLQGWGRNLGTIGPALAEGAKQDHASAESAQETADAIAKLAQQGDDSLPASKVVVGETQAIAAEAKVIAAERDALARRASALAARADALPATYRREHETDEDRLAGGRGGRVREKRADVTAAERDT